jgi:hypothetical protein
MLEFQLGTWHVLQPVSSTSSGWTDVKSTDYFRDENITLSGHMRHLSIDFLPKCEVRREPEAGKYSV